VIVPVIISLICVNRTKLKCNMNSCIFHTLYIHVFSRIFISESANFFKLTGLCVGGKVCEFLSIMYEFPSSKDHAMAHVSGWQHVTTDMWISFWVHLCEIHGGQNGSGKGCHRLLLYFLVSIISLMLYTHLHLISGTSG
jgi:hypothetical protein